VKTDRQALVQEFHERFGAPVAERPTLIPRERAQLRVRLIAEELQEYALAAGLPVKIVVLEEHGTVGADLVEVADALGDLEYVVLGSAVEHGIRLDPVVREIHRSNMTKSPATDEGGKILKGPDYRPPELAGIVADQQAGKLPDEPRRKVLEQALVAGFKGGWAAAMLELAEEIQRQAMRARLGAGGRAVALEPRPLVKMLRERAHQPPTPQTVAMRPGETPEEATARPGAATTPEPVPPAEGPFPSAQEALPALAGLLTAIAGERAASVRARYAEWVALCAFALAARRCAELDGVLEDLEREAAALDLLVLTPENGAAA
jgi:predicted HAD superfamily Cof-like phosphohydrolase